MHICSRWAKVKPFGPGAHFTIGAARVELWAISGISSHRGRLSLCSRNCAGHSRGSNFLARLELGHLALKFGRKILKDS